MKLQIAATILLTCSLSQAKVLTCTETAQSAKDNEYGRVLTIEISKDQQKMHIHSPADSASKELDEVVVRNDRDTSNDEDGNLDEDYDRKKEARFAGSDDIISTDTGTTLFISKSILAGKPGVLRLSSGQGNDSDSGLMILWFEAATLNCK